MKREPDERYLRHRCGGLSVALLVPLLLVTAATSAVSDERFLTVKGASIFVRTLGEGTPLLWVHGGPGLNHSYFLPHLEALADDFQIILYDQRAQGRSLDGVEADSVRFETFVSDLESLRVSLELDSLHLVGHSWGGLVAMRYAANHPEHLASFVLINSVSPRQGELQAETDGRAQAQTEATDRDRMATLRASERFKSRDPEAVAEYFKLSWRSSFFHKDLLAETRLELGERYPEGAALIQALFQDPFFQSYDLYPELASIRAPTLVLHGRYDPIPEAVAEGIAERIEGSQLVLIDDCGHFPFIDCGERFFDALRGFYRDLPNHDR